MAIDRVGTVMTKTLDEDDFERILQRDGGEEVVIALGVRAASRAVPLLAGLKPPDAVADEAAAYILVALRALAVADAWLRYPGRRDEIGEAARNAAFSAAKIRPFKTGDTAAGRAAAQASIEACASVAFTGTIESGAGGDVAIMLAAVRPSGLPGHPLWPDGEPDWLAPVWTGLREALVASDESWQFWVDWYEALRDGRPADEEALEVARVTIADETWLEGPTSANDALIALADRRVLN